MNQGVCYDGCQTGSVAIQTGGAATERPPFGCTTIAADIIGNDRAIYFDDPTLGEDRRACRGSRVLYYRGVNNSRRSGGMDSNPTSLITPRRAFARVTGEGTVEDIEVAVCQNTTWAKISDIVGKCAGLDINS